MFILCTIKIGVAKMREGDTNNEQSEDETKNKASTDIYCWQKINKHELTVASDSQFIKALVILPGQSGIT